MIEPVERPERERFPIFSVVGLVSLALALLILAVTQFQNSATLNRIEKLQAQQQELLKAKAPATRLAICNLDTLFIAFTPPPTDPKRLRAWKVIRQNIEALDCPEGISELPPEPP